MTQDIGWAVKQLHEGRSVGRSGWHGAHWITLRLPDNQSDMEDPYVYIDPENGGRIPWLCSQSDLLATDWYEVTSK
ncbi:MAG: MW1434 family type I TA system toxin [Acidimicrobiia bacterium]